MVGDIIFAPFPFTNLRGAKNRPVLVVADVGYPNQVDWIVCEVTSQPQTPGNPILLAAADFQRGRLLQRSWVRPERMATLNESVFGNTVGRLTDAKLAEILTAVRALF